MLNWLLQVFLDFVQVQISDAIVRRRDERYRKRFHPSDDSPKESSTQTTLSSK